MWCWVVLIQFFTGEPTPWRLQYRGSLVPAKDVLQCYPIPEWRTHSLEITRCPSQSKQSPHDPSQREIDLSLQQ
jgi:hypothetical protein